MRWTEEKLGWKRKERTKDGEALKVSERTWNTYRFAGVVSDAAMVEEPEIWR